MTPPRSRCRTRAAGGLAATYCTLAALALLAACATPEDHLHTLRPAAAPRAPGAAGTGTTLVWVGPARVPESVDRPGWVLRDGAHGLVLLEHQRWTQGLAAEIAEGLSVPLDDALAGTALRALPDPQSVARTGLRLRVTVLRFDSRIAPVPAVDDQIRWQLECAAGEGATRRLDGLGPLVGLREVAQAAGAADGPVRYEQLARGHAAVLAQVAADVAVRLRSLPPDALARCPAD